MVQELYAASPTGTETTDASCIGGKETNRATTNQDLEDPTRILRPHGNTHQKGDMQETDLYNALNDEFDDLGYKDFNELLLRLEVAGKIRTTSLSRAKNASN
jgi:hypothetical protein